MSQVILASESNYFFNGDLTSLPKPIPEMKIAYIPTASAGERGEARIRERMEQFSQHQCNFEVIDLLGITAEELAKRLADKELFFVEMGNSFRLLNAVNESGFTDIVRQKVIAEGATYFGASAGAYVACPTIEMATWKRDMDWQGLTDLKAMELVPFLVTAHYEPKYEEILRPKIKECKYPVKVLTDGQAFLVENGEIKLMGEGEETIIMENYETREPRPDIWALKY